MKKFIVGNWKMNGSSELLNSFMNELQFVSENADIVICPPNLFLQNAVSLANKFQIGAQDCSAHQNGAFTGDISAEMLNALGVPYVIVGHSERRHYHRETNDMCAAKVKAAQQAGVTPIFCIGESRSEYEAKLTYDVIFNQLETLTVHGVEFANLIIAYEPVWAIGTGLVPDMRTIQQVMGDIDNWVAEKDYSSKTRSVRLLYGGSVNVGNSASILGLDCVDGVLVGGASLDCAKFIEIATSASS